MLKSTWTWNWSVLFLVTRISLHCTRRRACIAARSIFKSIFCDVRQNSTLGRIKLFARIARSRFIPSFQRRLNEDNNNKRERKRRENGISNVSLCVATARPNECGCGVEKESKENRYDTFYVVTASSLFRDAHLSRFHISVVIAIFPLSLPPSPFALDYYLLLRNMVLGVGDRVRAISQARVSHWFSNGNNIHLHHITA